MPPKAAPAAPARSGEPEVLHVAWADNPAKQFAKLAKVHANLDQDVHESIALLESDGFDFSGRRMKFLCFSIKGNTVGEIRLRGGHSPWRLIL
jgi:hypothetical protein